ncbi:MAG: sugar ABC transporter permease [Eubacteriales bacterium]|nr:sugar ABC transporter permease [Eubacteriales bacterium]
MQRRNHRSQAGWITFFVTPGLLIVFVFILLPLFMSLFNSFFAWNQLIRLDFVGLDNFKRLFTGYPYQMRFFNALGNNAKWFVVTMVFQNLTGLLFGYVLSRRIAGNQFYRRVFFIPVLFSIVAVGFLWGLYLRPNGMINSLLTAMGLGQYATAWLGNEKTATYAIILVNIWRWVGFPALVFMTAIDNVPAECTEAAYLDGTNEGQMFFHIVLPLIVPAITIITVLTIIGSLNVFEQVYTMAGLDGAPNYATDTIGTLFYRTAFGSVDSGSPEIGVGSAIAVVIYLMTFAISLISIGITKSREVEL